MSRRILVVDDDASIRDTFEHHLARSGHHVATAASAEEALDRMAEFDPALVITDLRMPGMDGLELLRRLRDTTPDIDVLVITAHEDMRSAMEAMKAGAYDYLVKPLDLDQIDLLIERCFQDRKLKRQARQLSAEAAEPYALNQLVGRDPRMIEIYKLIGSLAANRAPVLIRGETGTGKELIARAIHFNSADAQEPFIAVNCTALTETLLESELFGHVRGAFTGAVADHKGRFELAGAGTIFLDEIADVSPPFQAKLLRVLENHEFVPVGGERTRRTDARVIAATNRSIEERVRSGDFRDDLYFRLQVVEIWVPPLRERRDDIPLLANHLLTRIAADLHKDVRLIADDALRALTAYDWPGNVRELENTLTRAVVIARGPAITQEHLSLGSAVGVQGSPASEAVGDDATLDAVERAHVQRVLARTGGNKRQAARILGISRPRLDRLIARHGLMVTERDHRGHDS
ncbi:MAG: sigma-54-dependent Fis family transcriptional regulator [Gemmatimonadetes bacterium]|uniref:Sigma-54-dependent Fis family transcriptional regulator n=1 Tax=Candidatus Kutchimonas denitrificans TaxID=3056748 RepID=A0AAE4Z5T7_9BACT|nr:sigma-54-dependent Fis family transcriptional regulator [Gemmatimonadota bacterium]NIR74304.1 sigma-54-dependent Fis family transcriptional regulator [Candidatus Kutchimonas denitrificans]NIS02559.1 sigma-54-dependent Fis family transcriptional regulator [Gemmatimonadota bacterium]NIT68435.1 sigma-54-dependent Fis family transcriptional regulator [Gemmatimonadota bacterium]NIU51887.1 response regulator [Gemmatimonadota bacterium]